MVKRVEAINFLKTVEKEKTKGTLRDQLLARGYNTDWSVYSSMTTHLKALLRRGGMNHNMLGKYIWPSAVKSGRKPLWSGNVAPREDTIAEPTWTGNALIKSTMDVMAACGVRPADIDARMAKMVKASPKYRQAMCEIVHDMSTVVINANMERNATEHDNITLRDEVEALRSQNDEYLATAVARLFRQEWDKSHKSDSVDA